MNKVHIVNPNGEYERMYEDAGWELVNDCQDADLVQFTGGEDVSPHYYGEEKHPQAFNSPARDRFEQAEFEFCRDNGIPMVGVCRGGQFLHVMNGGDLWQHVQGHGVWGTHEAQDTVTGVSLQVTSTHHQMMRECEQGLTVLVGAHHPCDIKQHMVGMMVVKAECKVDVEAMYFEKTKCFCFQPHPEFDTPDALQCRAYFFNKIAEFFGLE